MAQLELYGGSSAIYRLNPFIVVKVPRSKGDRDDHAKEQANFDIIETYERHPNLVISYHRVQFATFLEFAGANLGFMLQEYQTRDSSTRQVLSASTAYPIHWRAEISAACAWMEKIGLAHGDLRPENIVINGNRVKIIDFDRSVQVGSPLEIGTEPFARQLDDGSYGLAGPVTEQFAVGSILYCLTRGFNPYEDEWFGKDHMIYLEEKFRNREFPQLGDQSWDNIIKDCWAGTFKTVQELHTQIASLVGQIESSSLLDQTMVSQRRAECERAVENGLVRKLVQHLL